MGDAGVSRAHATAARRASASHSVHPGEDSSDGDGQHTPLRLPHSPSRGTDDTMRRQQAAQKQLAHPAVEASIRTADGHCFHPLTASFFSPWLLREAEKNTTNHPQESFASSRLRMKDREEGERRERRSAMSWWALRPSAVFCLSSPGVDTSHHSTKGMSSLFQSPTPYAEGEERDGKQWNDGLHEAKTQPNRSNKNFLLLLKALREYETSCTVNKEWDNDWTHTLVDTPPLSSSCMHNGETVEEGGGSEGAVGAIRSRVVNEDRMIELFTLLCHYSRSRIVEGAPREGIRPRGVSTLLPSYDGEFTAPPHPFPLCWRCWKEQVEPELERQTERLVCHAHGEQRRCQACEGVRHRRDNRMETKGERGEMAQDTYTHQQEHDEDAIEEREIAYMMMSSSTTTSRRHDDEDARKASKFPGVNANGSNNNNNNRAHQARRRLLAQLGEEVRGAEAEERRLQEEIRAAQSSLQACVSRKEERRFHERRWGKAHVTYEGQKVCKDAAPLPPSAMWHWRHGQVFSLPHFPGGEGKGSEARQAFKRQQQVPEAWERCNNPTQGVGSVDSEILRTERALLSSCRSAMDQMSILTSGLPIVDSGRTAPSYQNQKGGSSGVSSMTQKPDEALVGSLPGPLGDKPRWFCFSEYEGEEGWWMNSCVAFVGGARLGTAYRVHRSRIQGRSAVAASAVPIPPLCRSLSGRRYERDESSIIRGVVSSELKAGESPPQSEAGVMMAVASPHWCYLQGDQRWPEVHFGLIQHRYLRYLLNTKSGAQHYSLPHPKSMRLTSPTSATSWDLVPIRELNLALGHLMQCVKFVFDRHSSEPVILYCRCRKNHTHTLSREDGSCGVRSRVVLHAMGESSSILLFDVPDGPPSALHEDEGQPQGASRRAAESSWFRWWRPTVFFHSRREPANAEGGGEQGCSDTDAPPPPSSRLNFHVNNRNIHSFWFAEDFSEACVIFSKVVKKLVEDMTALYSERMEEKSADEEVRAVRPSFPFTDVIFRQPPYDIDEAGCIGGLSLHRASVSEKSWTLAIKRVVAVVQWCTLVSHVISYTQQRSQHNDSTTSAPDSTAL